MVNAEGLKRQVGYSLKAMKLVEESDLEYKRAKIADDREDWSPEHKAFVKSMFDRSDAAAEKLTKFVYENEGLSRLNHKDALKKLDEAADRILELEAKYENQESPC